MSKAETILSDLKKEVEDEKDNLLSAICDACHWPYIAGHEEILMRHCDECTICDALQALLKKQGALSVGEVMAITAQEILEAVT